MLKEKIRNFLKLFPGILLAFIFKIIPAKAQPDLYGVEGIEYIEIPPSDPAVVESIFERGFSSFAAYISIALFFVIAFIVGAYMLYKRRKS